MKILIAWELGGNWGHLACLVPLARLLRQAGHEVVFAVRNMDADLSVLVDEGIRVLATPVAHGPLRALAREPVAGYADVLARCGFADPRMLRQLVHAWRSTVAEISPGLVISKYAPLADFATRDCPVIAVGTGFELPPLTMPLPLYDAAAVALASDAGKTEHDILHAMNACGVGSFSSAAQAFAHTRRLLLTSRELDHFGAREGAEYLGPAEDLPADDKAQRKLMAFLDTGPASFAYLRLGAAWLAGFLAAVERHAPHHRWVVVDPSLTAGDCAGLSRGGWLVLNLPVNATECMHRFASVVCHAGHGTVALALARGVRLLLLPRHPEQAMVAARACAHGGVKAANGAMPPDELAVAFRQLLDEPPPVAPEILGGSLQRIVEIVGAMPK